jgi:hypothetical protein
MCERLCEQLAVSDDAVSRPHGVLTISIMSKAAMMTAMMINLMLPGFIRVDRRSKEEENSQEALVSFCQKPNFCTT